MNNLKTEIFIEHSGKNILLIRRNWDLWNIQINGEETYEFGWSEINASNKAKKIIDEGIIF